VLVLVSGLAWLAQRLLDSREALRVRNEIEGLGGHVEVEPGPLWLSWLIGQRGAERVVGVSLANVRGFDPLWVTTFPELESVSLFHVPLSDEALPNFEELRHLRSVNLMRTYVPKASLRHLAKVPNLEQLGIGPANDEMLVYLTGCNRLQVLRIFQSEDVTDAGLRYLSQFPELRQLQLIETGVTQEGARRLREQYPSLEIIQVP
jgi:hypothetical protein